MSLAEFQAYLSRLCLSASFRRVFELEPDTAMAGYTLTDVEKGALQEINSEQLRRFADGLARYERLSNAAAAAHERDPESLQSYDGTERSRRPQLNADTRPRRRASVQQGVFTCDVARIAESIRNGDINDNAPDAGETR